MLSWVRESRRHLKQVEQNYAGHGLFALKWGFFLIWTGFASIIHGLVPGLFQFTAPRNLQRLNELLKTRREFMDPNVRSIGEKETRFLKIRKHRR